MRIRDKIDKKKVSHYLFNDEEIICMNKKYFNDNYIHKTKIIEMIKEIEFEIKYSDLDKCSQYYEFINLRKFAIAKLYELLEED